MQQSKHESIRDTTSLGKTGRPGGNRTPNLRFWRPLLCQLSYWPVSALPLEALCRHPVTAGAIIAKGPLPDNPRQTTGSKKEKASLRLAFSNMELVGGIEPPTSPLPRVCSTPELHEQNALQQKLERAAGIEPASSAWKAEVLPLNYARLPALTTESTTGASAKSGGGGRIRTFEAFAADLQSAPFGHSGTPPNHAVNSTAFRNNVKRLSCFFRTAARKRLPCERAAFCQSSMENARLARIFSSVTGAGTSGAPDSRPARSAAV